MRKIIQPFRKAIDEAISVLDEDGDGDVSLFEIMTSNSAQRAAALHTLEHGLSETAHNLGELIVDGAVDETEGGHGSRESKVVVPERESKGGEGGGVAVGGMEEKNVTIIEMGSQQPSEDDDQWF